jgi:DNA-binding IclR family transcriptional regulator
MGTRRATRGAEAEFEPTHERTATGSVSRSNSVQKVCALLRAIAAQSPRRLSELSAAAGLNKVTALRILDILMREGFVQRAADGRGYGPGPEILALGASTTVSYDLREVARPSLVRLAHQSEDTVLLSVRSGVEAICIDRQIGSFPIRANYLDIGSRRPLGVGAGSLALLVRLPDREIDAILDVLTERLAEYQRLSEKTIRDEIRAARQRGYVMILDRIIDKMGGIGVPVVNAAGSVVAALSIAALSERVRDRAASLGEALLREADLIKRDLMSGSAVAPLGEPRRIPS